MQFENDLSFLEHFGMPLAPEQRELLNPDGSTYMLCTFAVPDPVYFAREYCFEPMRFPADDGSESYFLLPTVFERWPEEDEEDRVGFMVDEEGWDEDLVHRLPCLLGRGYEPWNEHSLCSCCEQEPGICRVWGLWPLEPHRARLLAGQLEDLFESSGWMDTFRHHRILDCEGYRDIDQVLETATAQIDSSLPEKLYQAVLAKQMNAMDVYKMLEENPVKTAADFKPEDFQLEMEFDLHESWTRLQARRNRYLAALPRVLPEHASKERFFVQWP